MDTHFYDDHEYLLDKMEPVEAISHLIHSRVFELLGYIQLAKQDESTLEDIYDTLTRLEEITERLITEFHSYLDYYHLSDHSLKMNS